MQIAVVRRPSELSRHWAIRLASSVILTRISQSHLTGTQETMEGANGRTGECRKETDGDNNDKSD